MRTKIGQQEMVGFVLIVVLVVVGMMVFLVISLGGDDETVKSVEVDNALGVIMKQTSECVVSSRPDNFGDLFESYYEDERCRNLNRSVRDYMNETLPVVIEDMMASEVTIAAYEIYLFDRDELGDLRIWDYSGGGNCTGRVSEAQRLVGSGNEDLFVRMRICRN